MELLEEISFSMDNNEYTSKIKKKAFDTVDYGLLMRKPERYGIRYGINLYKWIMLNQI